MDPGWYVRIVGDTNYMHELAEQFTKPSLRIFNQEGEFYVWASGLNDLETSDEVRVAGIELNEWARLALADEDAREALAILGREDVRWHDLYSHCR